MKHVQISIIDDDVATRLALAALMRAKGFDAKVYESAEEFLQAGVLDTSQCIITDIQMPGLSGIDLKRRLNDGKCTVPVIMITTEGGQGKVMEAVQLGAKGYVRKPFTAEQIKEKLAGIL